MTDWPVAALSSLPPSCWSTFPSLSTWCCSHCSRPRPSAPGLSWQEVGVWRRLPFSAVSFGPEVMTVTLQMLEEGPHGLWDTAPEQEG